MGLRVWSGGEIFGKKIKTKWGGAYKAPPPPSKLRLSRLLYPNAIRVLLAGGGEGVGAQIGKLLFFFTFLTVFNEEKSSS